MSYLVTTILLISVLLTKLGFLTIMQGKIPLTYFYFSVLSLVFIIIFGSISYFVNRREVSKNIYKINLNILTKSSLVLIFIFILFSFLINLNKNGVLWDAVALYDARAKFLLNGFDFNQMVGLSKYDPQNSYYYVLYPPHTSMLHFFWYKLGIQLPVGTLYSIMFLLLALLVFAFAKNRLKLFESALLTMIVVTNSVIFSSSLYEYTNLPFTLQMLSGVLLLNEYLRDRKLWKLIYGFGLVATTMWIRFLEPIWIAVVIAFTIALFIKKLKLRNIFIISFLMLCYFVLEYFSWQNYVSSFSETAKIITFSKMSLLEPVAGVFTGAFIQILIFFLKSWGLIVVVHLFAIYIGLTNKIRLNFLQIFLAFSIIIYFSGLYFVSFQSEWWNTLGDSLVRSSSFMIPISGLIILEYLSGKKS